MEREKEGNSFFFFFFFCAQEPTNAVCVWVKRGRGYRGKERAGIGVVANGTAAKDRLDLFLLLASPGDHWHKRPLWGHVDLVVGGGDRPGRDVRLLLLVLLLQRVAKANLVVWLCDDCSGGVWLFDHNQSSLSFLRHC